MSDEVKLGIIFCCMVSFAIYHIWLINRSIRNKKEEISRSKEEDIEFDGKDQDFG